MNLQIRYGEDRDREAWAALDGRLSEAEFARKVRDRRSLVLLEGERIIGILRWSLFWDEIPFCTLLYIREDCRGKGYGRALMARWEADMAARGHGMVLTSTQADETAQLFYRKLGYGDCGGFAPHIPGYAQPTELILAKGLEAEA